jgi:hypothetical protein
LRKLTDILAGIDNIATEVFCFFTDTNLHLILPVLLNQEERSGRGMKHTYRKKIHTCRNVVRKFQGKVHFRDLSTDVSIILKQIFEQQYV